MSLGTFASYGLGGTPLYRAARYCASGTLLVKLERENLCGSVKARTAYFILRDLVDRGSTPPIHTIVESTSGNLGVALGYFARDLGLRCLCLVDPFIPPQKLERLRLSGVDIEVVAPHDHSDYRSARIRRAAELGRRDGWVWINQYDNLGNFRAHHQTTGPEVWEQASGRVGVLVCSVGTGGTICGIAHYLKARNPETVVVAVEPTGSTIFGGVAGDYMNAGSGMPYPSGIMRAKGAAIDYYCKVPDSVAVAHCRLFLSLEGISVGVTSGAALAAASELAAFWPETTVVAIAPDGGESYGGHPTTGADMGFKVELHSTHEWGRSLAAPDAGLIGVNPQVVHE